MSQSQAWPLSEKANKQKGVCSICFATRQLHVKDGTVHLHGSRNNPCPGSNLAPVGQIPARPNLASQSSQITQLTSAPSSSADPFNITTPATPRLISHPSYTGPIIKHIPRSARPHIATELTVTINNVIHNPDDPSSWSALLEFGSTMLYAPARTGRRHNLASVLKKRSASSSKTVTDHIQDHNQRRPRKTNDDQCLATAVMTKIEDGNIKAAIRIITSDERPASDSAETLQALRERHPSPPSDRTSPPDPGQLPAVQFPESVVAAATHSFPAGFSGGPDGIRPQHLRDLITNKETGLPLVTALTALVNLLMNGNCPPSVTSVLFGGRPIALQKKSGGIRPIAIGYTWRRLAAKCANKHALTKLAGSLAPAQLGVGTLARRLRGRGSCHTQVSS